MLSHLLQVHVQPVDAVLLVKPSATRWNQRGWQVYRANAAVLAERALKAAFGARAMAGH
jgi:hypothetical protein